MSEEEKLSNPSPGYSFSPKPDIHAPGHPRLDVILAGEPSGEYFDPLEVHLPILASKDWGHPHQLDHIKIFHPWTNLLEYQAAPGKVIILDRKGKEVEAFTYGGNLLIKNEEVCTTCTLESTAPIIEIDTASHVVKTLIDESEILLAQRRASWGIDEAKFESLLTKISPEELYAVCLMHILTSIEHSPRQDVLDIQGLIHLIKQERSRLQAAGLWPEIVPSIEEIL